jgi:hypothetical protein
MYFLQVFNVALVILQRNKLCFGKNEQSFSLYLKRLKAFVYEHKFYDFAEFEDFVAKWLQPCKVRVVSFLGMGFLDDRQFLFTLQSS